MKAAALALALCALGPGTARAHPLRFGTMQVREQAAGRVVFELRFSGSEARPVGARPGLPAGCTKAQETHAPLAFGEAVTVVAQCDGSLAGREVSVEGLDEAGLSVLVEVHTADGRTVQSVVSSTEPALKVPLPGEEPAVFTSYLVLGITHILQGLDHLLFVLGLVLLVRRARLLLATITSFTVGHSITLALATLGLLNVPQAATEAAIAASILLLAVELTREPDPPTLTRRFPWAVAAAFGLLHGLGFAGALSEVGLPGGSIPVALFAFNVGVEAGQLLFVGVVLALLTLARRYGRRPSWTTGWQAVPPYAMGAIAAYLCIARVLAFFP